MLQGQAGSSYHTLQRVIGNVHRQFYFLAKPFIEAAEKRTSAGKVKAAPVNITRKFPGVSFQAPSILLLLF